MQIKNKTGLILRVSLPIVVLTLTISAFQNGVNVSDRDYVSDSGFFVQFYYALGLFALGGMDLGMPTDGTLIWRNTLLIMYFVAPLISAAAVIEGFWIALKPWFIAKWPWRNHLVVLGGGKIARAFIDRVADKYDNINIIVVDKNDQHDHIDHYQNMSRVYFLAGDIREPEFCETLRIGRAQALLILTGDEMANIEIAVQQAQNNQDTPLLVRVTDLELMRRSNRMLQKKGFEPCVNVHHAVAQKVCTDSLEHMITHGDKEVLLLTGFGRFSRTYLRDLLALKGAEQLQSIAIIDPNVELKWAQFHESLSPDHQAELNALPIILESGKQEDPRLWKRLEPKINIEDSGALVAIFGTSDDQRNLTSAMLLRERYPEASISVRLFTPSAFATQVGIEMHLNIVDTTAELKDAIDDWMESLIGKPH